jgi:hypothetical protein
VLIEDFLHNVDLFVVALHNVCVFVLEAALNCLACLNVLELSKKIEGASGRVKTICEGVVNNTCSLYFKSNNSFLELLVGSIPHFFVFFSINVVFEVFQLVGLFFDALSD